MKYLICEDALHAKVVDELVMCSLRDADGSKGSQWSGVFTDGTRYGVLWDSPVSDLFGLPEDFPELKLASNGEWALLEPEPAAEGSE